MERTIFIIVAATARKYYQEKNSILSQLIGMMNKAKLLWMMTALIFILGCGIFSPASSKTPDLFATLQASTPSSLLSPAATESLATPVSNFLSPNPTFASGQTSIPFPSASDQLTGHIVFTCQLF